MAKERLLIPEPQCALEWDFDPQSVVDLLCGKQSEDSYLFETAIQYYLLYVWAVRVGQDSILNRKSKREKVGDYVRDVARCIGGLVSVSCIDMSEFGPLALGHMHPSAASLGKQLQTSWHKRFESQFLATWGNISENLAAAHRSCEIQDQLEKAWDETLLVRDIVRFLFCVSRISFKRPAISTCAAALTADIFRRGPYKLGPAKHNGIISEQLIMNLLSRGLASAILLYSMEKFHPKFLSVKVNSLTFTKELTSPTFSRRKLIEVFLYYKQISTILQSTLNENFGNARRLILDVKTRVPEKLASAIDVSERLSEGELAFVKEVVARG